MRLSDIKTEKANLSEIRKNEFIVYEGRLAMFLGVQDNNPLANIQYLDNLDMALTLANRDTMLDRVVSVRIHQ